MRLKMCASGEMMALKLKGVKEEERTMPPSRLHIVGQNTEERRGSTITSEIEMERDESEESHLITSDTRASGEVMNTQINETSKCRGRRKSGE